ncbi:MAG: deoxyhypusine synthase family protein [Deltaproteobacteria bacterium]|nr:deoxyhypusine synthase family protein [Deltaproteobacteria bacterium]
MGETIRRFMQENYRHFNAAVMVEAAEAWIQLLERGGKMLLTMAGAMSTAELGISLAELIRQEKVHGISCTAANLEEDFFNLVAHDHYERVPHYRQLSPADEVALYDRGLNRVTDTCIPEETAMRKIEGVIRKYWAAAGEKGERYFPYEYFYQMIRGGDLRAEYQIDPKHSWAIAACEKHLPIYTPGWEDSTLANMFVADVMKGWISDYRILKSGVEQMAHLVGWYRENTAKAPIGFFQIGGGIAGDFPICVVPLIAQDLRQECRLWGYFCQISDSTTSLGSYSGAVPNEKITWGKLGAETPRFVIESDATIVAPLIFNYVLGR